MSQKKVLDDVVEERTRQTLQWGGPSHDDTHDAYDWLSYMGHQADKISEVMTANGYYNFTRTRKRKTPSPEVLREHFIKIAALAVAAVESLDRKNAKT